ncbi:hypothetical protein [Aneurinibacillus uraniidurans]|uniref:hypothetical protein n=1 Tax=Aneurinibacillus uraniidurans TaxID=2966586 RepID=UPI00234B6597|nr:hypothetical protein [Aneurinibacillus sp. B1]WCN36446.1 hypothetical protein PO771_11180 [Aneurinibacillus sp. B1]
MRTIKVDKKLDKHINIKVNNRKVKILKYKRSSYFDDYKNQEIFIIELITKIYNEVLDNKAVKIELDEKEVLNAEWATCFRQPGLYRFTYKIIDKNIAE